MKAAKYAAVAGCLIIVLLCLGMDSRTSGGIELLGPEVDGLRMGLEIESRYVNGRDSYTVRIRIVNTGSDPVTLVGRAPYEGELNNYAEWLQAEVCFSTFPELIPPSAQTAGSMRVSPDPATTIGPGKEFAVSWQSHGRYLKTEHYYNTTPYFPSDGLFGVRAMITLQTDQGKQIPLYSNEHAVCVGGSVALPKHGVAYVLRRDEEKREVTLSLGSRHRIVEGDRFHIMGRFPSGWMMTVVEVGAMTCRASVRITGDAKDMESLPPQHAKAQLWEFGQADAQTRSSAAPDLHAVAGEGLIPEAKSVHVGMTRKELREICHPDGGISTLTEERYVFNEQPQGGPEGMVLKVRVSLKPAELSEELYLDADKFKEWRSKHGAYYGDADVVMGVSGPYWEPPYSD